ncbi:MAG: PAM68 family protein [Microcoleaceae cyanobacterium MO_207.B10]|nr:PAM68 family protein [Microcoleaceae cyanobacterium MO_207.B10]
MSSEAPRERLPFEPGKNPKKQGKNSSPAPTIKAKEEPNYPTTSKSKNSERYQRQKSQGQNAIPEIVSQRMVSRMVILSGTPLMLALLTFVGSYFIITSELFTLPNQAVLFVSMGFFGLSVVGLSYGIFSASWEENNKGSLLGWQEFTTNFERMKEAWRSAKSKS